MAISKIISSKKVTFNLDNKLKKICGRKVLGINGEIIGKVKAVIGNLNKIEGILIKRKNVKTFIDYTHIQDLYSKSVMLKINPISRIIGMHVFDSNGENIGKVIDFTQVEEKNELFELIVKKGFFGKKKTIDAKEIEVSDKNIILNSKHE